MVDPEALRVVASLPERDLGQVAVGQRAELISAYDDSLRAWGAIARIAPVVDANSGTFRVTITQDAGQTGLRPGQYVLVQLEIDKHTDVLVVQRDAVLYEDGDPVVYRMIAEPPADPDTDVEEDEPDEGRGGWMGPFWEQEAEVREERDEEEDDDGPRMIAERVRVELGLQDPRFIEISEGLQEGDQLIVVGQANLQDGGRVRTARVEDESADDGGSGDQG